MSFSIAGNQMDGTIRSIGQPGTCRDYLISVILPNKKSKNSMNTFSLSNNIELLLPEVFFQQFFRGLMIGPLCGIVVF